MKRPEEFNPFEKNEAHDMWDVAAALRAQQDTIRDLEKRLKAIEATTPQKARPAIHE